MRALILILLPPIAFAQTYATGQIDSLSVGGKEKGSIFSTQAPAAPSGDEEEQKAEPQKGIYRTSGYDAEKLSQSEGPILYTRDANGDVYEIKNSDCIAYVIHESSADVKYEAANDISANQPLNPEFQKLVDEQRIFLDIPISNYIDGADFNAPLSDQARVNVGDVVVKEGKAFFNGEEIIPQAVVECGSDVIATPSEQ